MAPDRNLDPDFNSDSNRSPKLSSPLASPLLAFSLIVGRFYASLIRRATSVEPGLGGRLLYAGELREHGRALMVAANIAGAASLAASADTAVQKQAIHEGVADFLVTNLDEALRILKNEVRKHEPVAVCIAASPASIEHEMLDRGVLPDLVRDPGPISHSTTISDKSRSVAPNLALAFRGHPVPIAPLDPPPGESLLAWSIDEAPAKWLPRLGAIAMDCLASDESPSAAIARRWLRLAPRYLGRLAGNVRVLRCPTPTAHAIALRMRASAESGEIPVPVRIDFVQP